MLFEATWILINLLCDANFQRHDQSKLIKLLEQTLKCSNSAITLNVFLALKNAACFPEGALQVLYHIDHQTLYECVSREKRLMSLYFDCYIQALNYCAMQISFDDQCLVGIVENAILVLSGSYEDPTLYVECLMAITFINTLLSRLISDWEFFQALDTIVDMGLFEFLGGIIERDTRDETELFWQAVQTMDYLALTEQAGFADRVV